MNLKIAAAVTGLMMSLVAVPAVLAGETEDAIAKRLTDAVPGLKIVPCRSPKRKACTKC